MEKENYLLEGKHVLIIPNEEKYASDTHYDYLKKNFCGNVITDIDKLHDYLSPDVIVWMCGDINKNYDVIKDIKVNTIYVIGEFSYNYDHDSKYYQVTNIGKVPVNIHGVGVYFRNFFDNNKDHFNLLKGEHEFHVLTESNKPSNAYRKGIYLSKVEQTDDGLLYNLLRCSSNLDGPTDNFRKTDTEIITQLNDTCQHFFDQKVQFNHVLAQIYENSDQAKAKIKAHSDKTKDMPRNGLMAFCTFYDKIPTNKLTKKSETDTFDICYKKSSVLTRLHFRLKDCVKNNTLVKQFSITLYPNSVFVMSLSMNRMYTHEIVPSTMPHDIIPVRMGYVVRCSKTQAVYKDGQTFLYENGQFIKLEEPTTETIQELRDVYFAENVTDKLIEYGSVTFSMNKGDYSKPNI